MKLESCVVFPNLKITKKGCANLFKQTQKETQYHDYLLSAARYCVGCKTGAENYQMLKKSKVKEEVTRKKICLMYQLAPTRCQNEKAEGIFFKSVRQNIGLWNQKIFCSSHCAKLYQKLKKIGMIK